MPEQTKCEKIVATAFDYPASHCHFQHKLKLHPNSGSKAETMYSRGDSAMKYSRVT